MILDLNQVSKTFPDGTEALKNISFSLESGDFCVIGGANGSGKSVLMSLIAKLENPTSGKIATEYAGLVFQEADSQILGETPLEDVFYSLTNTGLKPAAAKEKALKLLEKVGLKEKAEHNARTLSGGEKRRLAVASVLALEPNIIIFDEPFANLDWKSVKQLCNLLLELKNQGKTIILLTHEIEKILALANRFLILYKGEIVFDGNPETGLKENLENYVSNHWLASLWQQFHFLSFASFHLKEKPIPFDNFYTKVQPLHSMHQPPFATFAKFALVAHWQTHT